MIRKTGDIRWIILLVAISSLFLILNFIYSLRSIGSEDNFRFDSEDDSETSELRTKVASLQRENLLLSKSLQANSAKELQSFRKIKIYCMVPSMFTSKKFSSWSAILRTWGHRCDILKFFVDPVYKENYHYMDTKTIERLTKYQETTGLTNTSEVYVYLSNDKVKRTRVEIPKLFVDEESGYQAEIVVIDMQRQSDIGDNEAHCWSGGKKAENGEIIYVRCKHIWEKVWRSWVYMHDTDVENADYFFKIDDDTFFFPDFVKLHAAEHHWNPEDTHYFGHHLHHGRVKTGFIAGAAVGYSRGTLRRVVPLYKRMPREYGDRKKFKHGRCVDRDGATQELAESKCLSDLGILAEDTRDINGFEKISLHGIGGTALLMRRRNTTTYWYWHNKENSALCCSNIPIAFHHYKHPDRMLKVHRLFFDKSYKFLMDLYSDHTKTAKVQESPSKKSEELYRHKALSIGGTNLAKYEEIQYVLHVREMLELFDLYE